MFFAWFQKSKLTGFTCTRKTLEKAGFPNCSEWISVDSDTNESAFKQLCTNFKKIMKIPFTILSLPLLHKTKTKAKIFQ